MTLNRMEGKPVNGARTPLRDVIPLPRPYTMSIFPTFACNFKCRYCIQAVPQEERKNTCNRIMLSLDTYKKLIDDLIQMGEPIPALHFGGHGEPLLHPDIIEMVRYAKEKNAAKMVDIVTNGVLLHREMADGLIAAGVDRLRISIQGLEAQRYKEMCNATVDLAAFLKDLAYLFEHREQTRIYLKIIDVELEGHTEEEFIAMFGRFADEIAVEHLIPLAAKIDYEKEFARDDFRATMGGLPVNNAEVCPQPFYYMMINPDGDILPCCMSERPIILGNIEQESLIEIWNGRVRQTFLKKQLAKQKAQYPVCRDCTYYRYGLWPEDYIDDVAEDLLRRCFGM